MKRELCISPCDDSPWATMVDNDLCDIDTSGKKHIFSRRRFFA